MMVIIFGKARAEFCLVRKKDHEKHFFKCRKQLYRVPPNGLSRCRINFYGKITEEEVIAYPEDEIFPYQPQDVKYSMDEFLMEIDGHKRLTGGNWFGKHKSWFTNSKTGIDIIGWLKQPSSWGIIIGLIIIIPMFIKF